MILDTDHIDLLMTAVHDWSLLATDAMPDDGRLMTATGFALQGANAAHLRALARAGRLDLETRTRVDMMIPGYTWERVTEPYEPIDVLKATHSAMAACAKAPQWKTTRICHVLEALATAAAQRLPGYDTAAWEWRRAESITAAVGCAGTDTPPGIAGLTWVTMATLEEQWDSAVQIVLTPSALDQLDDGLPERRGVVILTLGDALTPTQWEVASSLGAATVVEVDAGLPWLEALLEQMNAHVPSAA